MPEADALYGCDGNWWERRRGVPGFKGLKITRDRIYAARLGLHCIAAAPRYAGMLLDQRGLIGWGGNSGFQALNWVIQCGVRWIALVGYDMRLDLGTHWHGRHPLGLNNPSPAAVARWRSILDEESGRLCSAGIEVINCSEVSVLIAYPKMSLLAALDHFEERRKQCREQRAVI